MGKGYLHIYLYDTHCKTVPVQKKEMEKFELPQALRIV